MTTKHILLALDKELHNIALQKSKKLHYKTVQQYIYELIRRDLFRKKSGGRPKIVDSDEAYLNKFSTPTKETYKIQRMIKEGKI